MDLLARAGDAAKRLWSSLDSGRRVAVGLAAVLLVLLLGWGSRASSGDWQQVAGSEVDQASRADVAAQLKKSGQRHEIRDGGIWVPRADAERVVLELAGQGVLSDRAIWQWLEKSDIMADRWDKNARMQVALQRKLESMIRKIDAVRGASVLITPESESTAWGFKGAMAKASVQVELKMGAKLSDANVRSIAGIVSGSVKGLDRDRVVIGDTQGNSYAVPKVENATLGASGIRDIEARLEADIKAKVLEVFPQARVVVRAIAKSTAERRKDRKLGPGQVEYERERKVTAPASSGQGASMKGAGDLQGPAAPPPPPVPPQEREIETKSKFGESETEQDNPAGSIERVTVGVLLPVPADANGKPVGPAPDEEKIREMVMKAGAIQNRSDVSVMLVPTKAPEAVPAPAATEQAGEWLRDNWTWAGLILLGVVALGLAARLVRGGPREDVVEIPARPAVAAASGEGDVLRDSVRDIVRRDPAEAAASLRSWMR